MKKLIIATSAALIGLPGLASAMTFSQADANKDGVVTYDEYVAAAKPIAELDFQTLDTDASGVLSADELRHNGAGGHFNEGSFTDTAAAMSKEKFVEWDMVRWQTYFGELDANGDKQLTAEEAAAKPDGTAAAADANGDRIISFEEYSMVYPEPTRQVFDGLDTNGDGKVSLGEIANIGPHAPYRKG